MAEAKRSSGDLVTVTAPANVTQGGLYHAGYAGGLFGVYAASALIGNNVDILTEGSFRLPKDAPEAQAKGAPLYYNAATGKLTTLPKGDVVAEVEVAALSADTLVRARLKCGGAAQNLERMVAGYWDASAGLAIGSHNWNGPPIPAGYRVTYAHYKVGTTFTSATDAATAAFGFPTDDVAGIKAAVAISNGSNPYDAGAPKATIQTGETANVSERLTAQRYPQMDVAVEALTAGFVTLYLRIAYEFGA